MAPSDTPLAHVSGGPLPPPTWACLPDVLLGAAAIDRPVLHLTADGRVTSSHRALLIAAQRVCGGLRARGVGPGRRVVVALDRSEAVLPVFWGSLLAGAVPLVMEVPERFAAGHKAYDQLVAVVAKLGEPLVVVEDDRVDAFAGAVGHGVLAAGPPDPDPHRAAPDALAFLCFSSGSTGDPKCVMLTHRCVLQRNAGANRYNRHRPDDVNLNWLPFDHIGSLTEHIRSLALGCVVVYVGKDHILEDPLRLLDIIDRHRITHTWGPNFIYALIARALAERAAELPPERWDLSCVRFLISGGEAASRAAMADFLDRAGRFGFPITGFRPSFGMVEVSAGVTYYAPTAERPLGFVWLDRVGVSGAPVRRVADGQPGARPYALLGRPIDGCALRVVDRDGRPVGEGVVGRVQFAGEALAAGYLDDPARTAAVFRADGWLETGDLGCVLDGELVLTGRTKDILIINGVNYDCRALEEVVEGVAGVELSYTAACAVADPTGQPGERLAIFFSPAPGADVGAVARAVREGLVRRSGINPHHIVPLAADAVPKTPIGKIRRGALARRFDRGDYGIGWVAPAATTGVAPRSPLEAALADIWADVLGRPVAVDDHFFEIGGDSIKAVTAVARLQQRLSGLEVSISLFDTPTVARLADWLEGLGPVTLTDAAAVLVVPDPAAAGEPFPLTSIQQAYWAGRSGAFALGGRSVHAYCEFEGRSLDPARLAAAWDALVARHPNLRTVIRDGRQQVLPEVPRYAMPIDDLRGLPELTRRARLDALRAELSHGVLPCDRWPTFDVRLALLPDDRVRIYTRFDALFFDARSRFIVFGEWQRLYAGEALPPLELTFRDYVQQIEAAAEPLAHDRAYWMERLDDLPAAPDLPLAAQPRSLGTPRFFQLARVVDRETWTRLQGGAARFGITPSGLLLAVFADALRPWSQSSRFLLNLTTYRRLPVHPQVNDVVGDFSALTLLAVEPPADLDFVGRAKALQAQLMRDLAHGTFGGVDVLRALARRRPEGLLAPVVFTSVLGDELQADGGAVTDWLGEVVYDITQTPQIFFDHIAFEEGGALQIRWNVVEGLFAPGVIEAIFDACRRHLDALAIDDHAWRAPWNETRARLMPPAQVAARRRYNQTAAAVPPELLHAGFERQARGHPDRTAIIAAGRTLDYGTLAAEAHRVGRYLIRRGAQPNTLVAVAMEKGWAQVVGALGVLTAGAAYLPVDPGLPTARLSQILERGAVRLVLTLGATDLPVPPGVQVIAIDGPAVAAESPDPVEPRQTPADLAYVIFTSGSTGRPKGVMIDHRGAHNTCVDINRRFAVGPDDRVLALSALSFDLSVYDIFGLLAAGGAIVMPRAADVREPRRWAALVEAHRVTVWNTVPAFVDVLLDDATGTRAAQLESLRLVMMSGDWIPLTVPPKIAALPGRPRAISLGGATEASIWSIWHPIERVEPHWTSVPYGRPLTNQSFHVLDDTLQPRPEQAPGMLYIGGAGVALGYFGDPERTAAAFIEHPETGERLYRTGDRGRFVIGADGALDIEFMGRVDLQVKVQGFRVELGDIEAALGRHPAVEQAVLVALGERHADKVLVAYVVGDADAESLRRHLAALLPAYMMPARFVPLDRLPLTANGKVDRKALPRPEVTPAKAPATRAASVGPVGALIADVLGRPVGADDDLFDLGATSVDIMRIVNRLEARLGLTVAVGAVFEHPTAAGIAAAAGLDGAADDDLLARYPAIIEPAARDAFGRAEHGLRRIEGPAVQLDRALAPELARLINDRRSHRHFDPAPMPAAALGALLASLRRFEEEGKPRYAYGSAGGLYPVQVGVFVKPGRVIELDGGFYHHDRAEHRLVRLAAADGFDPTAYGPAERLSWAGAAFGLFLTVDLRAVVPLYREASVHFAAIEAGLMCQLLEMFAPRVGVGLCQVGHVVFDRLRSGFAVAHHHRLVHALMGGPLPDDDRVEEEF